MGYQDDVRAVVNTWRHEIEADLALARQQQDRAANDLRQAQRQVATLEGLLAYADGEPRVGNEPTGRLTLHEAMRAVLQDAPSRMMRAADIASEVRRRDIYRMQDGRPVEPQQIHARVGHRPDMFTREGIFIKLL